MVSTCREIVRAVIDYGVEKDDWKKTWKADAQVGPFLPYHLQQDIMRVPVHNMHALVTVLEGQDQGHGGASVLWRWGWYRLLACALRLSSFGGSMSVSATTWDVAALICLTHHIPEEIHHTYISLLAFHVVRTPGTEGLSRQRQPSCSTAFAHSLEG